jgi:hypothetical protein
MTLRMSQMLRSSRDVRRGGRPGTNAGAVMEPPAPPGSVPEPEIEVPAIEEETPTPEAEGLVLEQEDQVAAAYDGLVSAADALFHSATDGGVPDGPAVIGAVRDAARQLADGDALLTETVRRRSEAGSWARRSVNVAVMAMRVGRAIDYDERRTLAVGLCGLTHDLGMLKVPEKILAAQRLTTEQLKTLQQHPLESAHFVRSFGPAFEWVAKIVAQVHEREDGSGYPNGLKGEAIHEFARIIGLVDTYEAMAQPRADRQARVVYNALKEIIDLRNSHFERRLIKALINIVSIFPLGSLVKLNNGEIGRVVATSRLHPTRPTVDILIDPRGRRLPEARHINLEDEPMLYIVDPAIEEGVLGD